MTLVDTATGEIVESRESKAERHDSTVERGVAAFIDVGLALVAIKADKLYLELGFATFDAYCQERHGIGSSRRAQLMIAATIAQEVLESSPIGEIPSPTRESQVRPLAALDDVELQREAWLSSLDAAGNDHPTAAQVAAAVAEVLAEQKSDIAGLVGSGATVTVRPGQKWSEPQLPSMPEVSTIVESASKPDPEDERSKAIGRRVKRLEMFCSSLHEFRALADIPDRQEVLDRLAPSDRQIILNAEREIQWTT